jgi:hypothetical protein
MPSAGIPCGCWRLPPPWCQTYRAVSERGKTTCMSYLFAGSQSGSLGRWIVQRTLVWSAPPGKTRSGCDEQQAKDDAWDRSVGCASVGQAGPDTGSDSEVEGLEYIPGSIDMQ